MTRRLLISAAILSLVLSIGTTVLWVRSYWIADYANKDAPSADTTIFSNRGSISVNRFQHSGDFPFGGTTHWQTGHAPATIRMAPSIRPGAGWSFSFFGFAWATEQGGSLQTSNNYVGWLTFWELSIPHAAIVLLAGAASAFAIYRLRIARRPPGCCRRCGYDLRATPQRCPECGTAV